MSHLPAQPRSRHRFVALYCVLLSCYGPELQDVSSPEVSLAALPLDPAPSSVETLFGSSLAEYWDARAGVTVNSGRVAAWAGLKLGTVLSAPSDPANQPVFGADGSAFAGTPVVQTSATDNAFLATQSPSPLVAAGLRPYIAVVHRSRSLSESPTRFLEATNGTGVTRFSLFARQASARGMYCPDSSSVGCQQRQGSEDALLTPVISELWVDGAGLHYARDGKEIEAYVGIEASQVLPNAIDSLFLGVAHTAFHSGQVSDSSFAQVVVTSAVPSATLRAAYRNYAMNAWGLQRCGDGILGDAEQCDDGNTNDADSCSNACTIPAVLSNTPDQLLGANVVEWWDSRVGFSTNSGGITAWRGQLKQTLLSPLSLEPARLPVHSADTGFFEGRPVIQSSEQNNAVLRGILDPTLLPQNTRPYIAVIHRSRTLSTVPERVVQLEADDPATSMALYAEDGAARALYCPNWQPGTVCHQHVDVANHGTATVLSEFWVDENGAHFAENGVESTTARDVASQALPRALAQITVGAIDSDFQVSNNNYAQIVLASARPTQEQRAQYLQYACAEWGLATCQVAPVDSTPTAVKTIFGSTLTEYWDARAGVATSSGRVSAWTGLRNGTVLNAPANSANQPVYGADGADHFGGAAVVQTSAADNAFLTAQLAPTLLATGARPYIAVVWRARSSNQASARILEATSTDRATSYSLFAQQTSSGVTHCADLPNSGCQSRLGNNDIGQPPVISEFWVDASGLHYARNGAEEAPSSGQFSDQALVRAIERLTLGGIDSSNELSDTSFAQVVVTAAVPTPAQRAAYRFYATYTWALHVCGDGLLGPNEQCDDGNPIDADACSNACPMNTALATTPVDVLGPNVVEWWDARRGVGSFLGTVSTWRGQTAGTLLTSNLAAPDQRPDYLVDAGYFLDRPVVQPKGANFSFLRGRMDPSLLPANTYPYLAVIQRSRVLSGSNNVRKRIVDLLSSEGPTPNPTQLSIYAQLAAAQGAYCPNFSSPECETTLNVNNQTTGAVLTEIWVDASGTHYAENGIESAAMSGSANQALLRSLDRIGVGGILRNNQVSNTSVAQIVVADSTPTTAQRAAYLQYACAEWGLSGCQTDGFPPTGTPCAPMQPSCGIGRECRNGVGVYFGRSASDYVCWDTGCDDYQSGVFECGSRTSLCGTVCPVCTENCEGKSCGSNGCWGSCPGICAEGQAGCRTASDCADGLVCLPGPDGLGVCRLEVCANVGTNPCSDPANAGLMTDCGLCPACTPDCGTDRVCGAAPNGCGTCDSVSLGENEFCSADGTIGVQYFLSPELLPEGMSTPAPGPDDVTTGGTLPGAISVNAFGQGTYSIPLDLPPGRHGFGPNLTLTYNSTAENGYLGIGWGVSGLGLSAIQRCAPTIAQDGRADAITNTPADRFCLDGNRLVPLNPSDTYGADGTEYRTEVDSFSRIIAYGGSATEEPRWF